MAKIEFPRQLNELLAGSELFAPIRAFANKAGEILADNKLPFFPDYTDHGIEHVNRVLKTEVELVPKGVWEKSKEDSDPRLLCDVDAAIIIGATILHDIAMHLHPKGFLELIRKDSRFKPLKWFDQNHENYTADIPWFELWENYTREARRFSERQLSNIIGEKSAGAWKFDKLPEDPGIWELNHRLIIGEFIRRHHARLAHEIAIYGFPGLPSGTGDGQFPAIGEDTQNNFRRLADLIGLTARSHGISLRVCKDYLDYNYRNSPRPAGSAVLYPMALLRIADYFQIDQSRAPAVLLQLRDPQSPVSVQEWQKHQAVESIGPSNDPRGRMVTVSNDISLPLYLQLKELLESLQAEIDQSTAVLDEMYGIYSNLGLDQLNLAVRRIHSNLQTPAFLENLKYVPVKSGFSTDPNLLSLLVEPLYGNHPGVGVRELMQNAVDAVCELDAWCKKHDKTLESLDLPELGCDVLVEFEKMDSGRWILRVQDRGIGMTSDTIQNYFLRAGASFRHSAEWMQEFLDDDGKPRVARAGRFGIGAFAVFLLGSSFKLWTRHVGADKSVGYGIEVNASSQLIEIRRTSHLHVGTLMEIWLSEETIDILALEDEYRFANMDKGDEIFEVLNDQIDWFCWDWPVVRKQVKRGQQLDILKQKYNCLIRKGKLPPEWSIIHPAGFDAVYWTFRRDPDLTCNGLTISNPVGHELEWVENWNECIPFNLPSIAVLDRAANLPLTLQRYELSEENLPFRNGLERDILLSYIAHTLICGPTTQMEALSNLDSFPLSHPNFRYTDSDVKSKDCWIYHYTTEPYKWFATPEGMFVNDPWLNTIIKSYTCIMYGAFSPNSSGKKKELCETLLPQSLAKKILICTNGIENRAVTSWFGVASDYYIKNDFIKNLFERMVKEGISYTDMITEAQIVLSIDVRYNFASGCSSNNGVLWKHVNSSKYKRVYFETHTEGFNSGFHLQPLIESLEQCIDSSKSDIKKEHNIPKEKIVLFVTELKLRTVKEPESTLAKIWNECLGLNFIPFGPVARAELIEHGRKHPELKRHIEAWEEMKRTGSKWATGEWRKE